MIQEDLKRVPQRKLTTFGVRKATIYLYRAKGQATYDLVLRAYGSMSCIIQSGIRVFRNGTGDGQAVCAIVRTRTKRAASGSASGRSASAKPAQRQTKNARPEDATSEVARKPPKQRTFV
ncbi:hypothetical protein FRC02_001344 [Tulasnella sp. 418]|nr:hypothetical protein FRC02_001344 [Tulasnella sp. 418]